MSITNYRGKAYIEGKVKDDFQGDLKQIRSKVANVFSQEIVQDLSLFLWQEILSSEAFKGLFPPELESLKAVEHFIELPSEYFPIHSVDVEVNIYQILSTLDYLGDISMPLQMEIVQLPISVLEGKWERLIFDTNIRDNLIRLIGNMLKFSCAASNAKISPRMNHLILLSGPPGTGKTTLCQALAQKLSIRLNRTYSSTSLIEINAAALLSKFFSESAQRILQIFVAIHNRCKASPSSFTVVLIDEIESVASSRHTASSHGEVQDTIRATNALLMGIDKVKSLPNLVILCTSNMSETLDAAFIDRCGHQIIMEEPGLPARYQILRDGIQELITMGIIKDKLNDETNMVVPSYFDARLELFSEAKKAGSLLLKLCNSLGPSKSQLHYRRSSARYLSQLPEVALANRMISDSCTLNEALEHMSRFVHDGVMLETDQPVDSPHEEIWLSSGLDLKRKRVDIELTSKA